MEEEWKDIEGFENKYQISTKGNARSLSFNNTKEPKLLKAKINRYGYREFTLSKDNKRYFFLAMKLVAKAFIPNPLNKPQTTHISNDKLDDSVENIKWVFDSEKKLNMYKKGNRKIGKSSGSKIAFKKKGYKSYSAMAKANNITPQQLYKRLSNGWEFKDAVGTPSSKNNYRRKANRYEYYGENLTINQISQKIGIQPKQIYQRLYKKWGIYECEIPISIKKCKEKLKNEN